MLVLARDLNVTLDLNLLWLHADSKPLLTPIEFFPTVQK